MKHNNQSIALRDINKYKRFKGIYRIVGEHISDLDFDFYVNVMVCDGKSSMWMIIPNDRLKHCDFKVGAFVHIDCVNLHGSGWRVYTCALVASNLALESQGFKFNKSKFKIAENRTMPDLLLEVNSIDIAELIKVLEAKMFAQVKAGITFDDWLKSSVNRYLYNVVAVEFESDIERDYAITIGLIYAVFVECVGPTKRFDMTVKQDVTFLNLCQQMTECLAKVSNDLSEAFNTIILKTDPLTVTGSKLSNKRYISAIQIITCQAVECYGRDMEYELEEA